MDNSFSILIWLIIAAVLVVAYWRIFTKAGQPGWASLIPIYNTIVLLKIVGRPIWWVVLMFVPFVNIVVAIIVVLDLAKSFGRSALFGIGLLLLSVILVPILAFGDSQYLGPGGRGTAGVPRTV